MKGHKLNKTEFIGLEIIIQYLGSVIVKPQQKYNKMLRKRTTQKNKEIRLRIQQNELNEHQRTDVVLNNY